MIRYVIYSGGVAQLLLHILGAHMGHQKDGGIGMAEVMGMAGCKARPGGTFFS